MDIKTVEDVQHLVEQMHWERDDTLDDKINVLQEIAERELRQARHQVNQRVWDETFDDEMAAKARWQYVKANAVFHEAILEWGKTQL